MDAVLEAYETYPQSFREAAPISTDPVTAQALRDNFSHTGPRYCLASLRDEILIEARGRCPYCDISDPFTLDHHLPKSTFPEFAVFAPNLVALCDECNRAKRDATPDIEVWPHPYFDELDTPFLVGSVAGLAPVRVRFDIDVTNVSDPVEAAAIVDAHVTLNLLERYELEALEVIVAFNSLLLEEPRSAAVRRRMLERIAEGHEHDRGLNHWQSVTWRTLADNADVHNRSAWQSRH